MKLKAAIQKARKIVQLGGSDTVHVNAINNPAYSSTVVDQQSGRRSVMGTGRKGACVVMRESGLEPGQPRTVVVLGIARGGTSMVSGVLRGLDVYMGENLGFNHEDLRVQRIVRQQEFQKFGTLARKRDDAHDIWGFKFPEASTIMDRFHPELRNPHYVFVLRHPLSRGMSVVKRTGGELSTAITEALQNYQSIFSFLETVDAPVMLVNYEQATASSADYAQQLSAFLGIEASPDTIDRAAAMVVSEGAGYLNLPEYWFYAEESDAPAGKADEFTDVEPAALKGREINYARERASIWSATAGNFPKSFWLRFEIGGKASREGERIRLYYDYDDQFHPGHRVLIDLTSPEACFHIQTTGDLKRLAVVPLEKGCVVENVRFEIEPQESRREG